MELSPEDNLKLNVLVSQELQAVRIDESKMIVHALTGKGEAKIVLNPTLKDEPYLRQIREFFSTHALGSPGGYPVYLKRWTRMGQAREENLESLLLLGEPEAVVAVAHAQGLTQELARRTWWAMPTAEVARKMLANPNVADTAIGLELAQYLLEFLPFEEHSASIIESVQLVLRPGLLDEASRRSLWNRAVRKSAYYVGFLYAIPFDLPEPQVARSDYDQVCALTKGLTGPYATLIRRCCSAQGQTLLSTIEQAMKKASDQDMVVELFKAVAALFSTVRLGEAEFSKQEVETPEKIQAQLESLIPQWDSAALLAQDQGFKAQIQALSALSLVGEPLANPIFAQTDAVGSVMRKKLAVVFDWLSQQIIVLKTANL